MQGVVAVFLITLGLGQLISTSQDWRAASLVGPSRLGGYSLGLTLLLVGALILPDSWTVLGWTLLAGPLALGLLLWAGSTLNPPLHPDHFFTPEHPGHGSCLAVQIPDGEDVMPGLLLKPPPPSSPLKGESRGLSQILGKWDRLSSLSEQPGKAVPQIWDAPGSRGGVLLVHGAGDTKISFKWRLAQALLAEGLLVLTIDLPGHGDYRRRPLAYPDCLSAIPAALQFLRSQPGVERVGLIGISLGSAMAIRSLAEKSDLPGFSNLAGLTGAQVDALVALETPIEVKYSRMLRYREMWNAYHAPVLSLWREMTVKQMRQSWHTGGYVSRHKNTAEVISLLNPLPAIAQLRETPILLVHGERDIIAPPAMGLALRQAAPQATLLTIKKASHVTLTLMPEVNRQVAAWLREKLSERLKGTKGIEGTK